MTSVISLTGHVRKPMRNQWRGGEEGRNHKGMEKICTDLWSGKDLTSFLVCKNAMDSQRE